ncbi:MAG TPA: hypothetical protein PK359_17675 [Burkholderiaceae bacterium]|jgi:hypothetical protein|nr:hypothetical protein [Burkholderiaceae bacterium]
MLKAALAVALSLAATPAIAQIDCWMDAEHPLTADGLPVSDARAAPLRRALHELNAILHRQPELHALPRTRLRSSWQIGGQWDEPARAASFLLRDHRESTWTGACDVIKGADRLGPHAAIVVSFNAPQSFFESAAPELKDERLQAWREVPATGSIRGHTVYGGHMLVFTRDGRMPWVPVTTAEYLDFTERDLTRQNAAAQATQQAARKADEPGADEAMLQRIAEGLRKVDPAQADKLMADIRSQHARARAQAEATAARRRNNPALDDSPFQTMLQRVRAYRAGLTPTQLAAQARLGMNGLHPADIPPERYPLLARPDPAFPWDRAAPARAQMLRVSVSGGDRFEGPMRQVLQSLDLDALQRLVTASRGRPPSP